MRLATAALAVFDGKPRTIVSPQFVDFTAPAPGGASAAPAPRRDYSSNDRSARGRLIVLLIDQGNIRMPKETHVSVDVLDSAGKPAASSPATVISSADGVRHIVRASIDASSRVSR